MKLDLACGDRKQEGFTGIDIVDIEGVDIVHDLNLFPWPVEDDSVEEIWCNQYVEHVPDLMKFMNECYRILKVGGKMTITAPYYSSMRAWQDPTHVRAISEASWYYYNKNWRKENHLEHYPITCDFDFVYGHNFYPEWMNRSIEARAFALSHYINVATDIQVVLTKREAEKG